MRRVNIDLQVAELLCSRLCHDLIGPVGAVTSGVELLEDEGSGVEGEALEMMGQAAREASLRLRLFRVVFGRAGSAGVSVSEGRTLIREMLDGGRIVLEWPSASADAEGAVARDAVKLLLNMILLAVEALPRGGRLKVESAAGSVWLPAVVAEGAGAGLSAESLEALNPDVDPDALTARSVQAHIAACFAARQGLQLAVESGGVDICRIGVQPLTEG